MIPGGIYAGYSINSLIYVRLPCRPHVYRKWPIRDIKVWYKNPIWYQHRKLGNYIGVTWVAYIVFPHKAHVTPTCAKKCSVKCLAHMWSMLESYMCFPHWPQDSPMSKRWWATYWKTICSRLWNTCWLDVGRTSRCLLGWRWCASAGLQVQVSTLHRLYGIRFAERLGVYNWLDFLIITSRPAVHPTVTVPFIFVATSKHLSDRLASWT